MRAERRSLLAVVRMRLLRTVAPVLPANRLRCWALSAQGYALGRDVYIGEGLVVSDELTPDTGRRLRIGDRASIAQRVTIVLSSHPNNSRLAKVFGRTSEPVVIGEDAWIGAGALLLPGVTVGEASVVAAGAVVTRSIPPWSVAAGVPARVSRRIDPPDV